MKEVMKRVVVPAVLAAALGLTGCADMTPGQQRALSGSAIGATSGAVIGAIAGNAGKGAVIGAGVGLLGGVLVNEYDKSQQAAFQSGYAAGQQSR